MTVPASRSICAVAGWGLALPKPKRLRLAAVLSLVVGGILSGCGRSPGAEDFFPIGIYDVNDPRDLEVVKRAGFNAVETGRVDPGFLAHYSKAADKAGLRVLLFPQTLMTSTISSREFPVAAWYLFDEPDVHGMAPEVLADLDRRVRAWSPGLPTAFVLGDGRYASRFAGAADVLMVDWYPVPHLPLPSVGDHVRWAVEAAGERPVWAVLQAMDWREHRQRQPESKRVGRFPEMAEIRFMTYLALIEGARGLWYYTYTRPSGLTLAESPELWFALAQVVREVALLHPILEGGERLGPPEVLTEGLKGLLIGYKGRKYYILANVTSKKVLLPAFYRDMRFRPLFEVRRRVEENLDREKGGAWMEPWRVLVLEER